MSERNIKILDIELSPYGGGFKEHVPAVIHKSTVMTTVAEIATEMATRWGCVAGKPDGEDSAGRQRLALQEADELAERACATAAALWRKFEERDWLVEVPVPRKRTPKEQKEHAE